MRLVLALAALLLVPLASAVIPAPVPVAAAGFHFASPALVIPAGTTVEWIGAALPHTVTTAATAQAALAGTGNDEANSDGDADTFNAALPMGSTYSHTFRTPGEYTYHCELHFRFGMVGTIVVT